MAGEHDSQSAEGLDADGLDVAVEWAGLSGEQPPQAADERSEANDLVAYFRDCAVASQRSLAQRNVFEANDAQCLALPLSAWSDLVEDGLFMPGKAALDLALANKVNPFEKPLVAGALFIVGRHAIKGGRTRPYFAPLLVGTVSNSIEGTGVTLFLEGDVGLNLTVLAELAGVDAETKRRCWRASRR